LLNSHSTISIEEDLIR